MEDVASGNPYLRLGDEHCDVAGMCTCNTLVQAAAVLH